MIILEIGVIFLKLYRASLNLLWGFICEFACLFEMLLCAVLVLMFDSLLMLLLVFPMFEFFIILVRLFGRVTCLEFS